MADESRRTKLEVSFAGVNISEDVAKYLDSLSVTDNEEGTADDLQLKLHDRDGLWLTSWLTEAVDSAAAGKLKIKATIKTNDASLDCGEFELDTVEAASTPNTVTVKAVSLPWSAAINQTLKSKAWENYTLSGIANEIAGQNGMSCMYEASADPQYERQEQTATSDIEFLYKLCQDNGLSLKATGTQIVVFDQKKYESQAPALTIERGEKGKYTSYRLRSASGSTQYSACRVSWTDPETAQLIEGRTDAPDASRDSGQVLEIHEKVSSAGEAKALAEKRLRYANKLARTATFTMPGNTVLCAGVTVDLTGFGGWDGRYLCTQAKHSVSDSGYTTSITLRKVLEGY